ncbi:hypothetical protein RchiOBHm_Chr3g0478501 [Rosa chinensis]|uniref:Uncharacterized protein n=1 Tax=Rosa chinensis TaxID=74649 RepID=A0A2P6RD56_ROSCH|nr:hypothetical protein RchiOBHm_Chr3g0478501 [Rosa chinensis]
MGKFYKEEITCHVIDMDDTNVLFGRPWHESVKGGYCKDDTYLFRWESHKIKIKLGRKNIKNYPPKVFEKKLESKFSLPVEINNLIEEKLEEFLMEEPPQEFMDEDQEEVKDEIAHEDIVICTDEVLEPKINHSEPDVIQEYNLESCEESTKVAYNRLIYGVGFMIVSSEYAEDPANNPHVQLSNFFSGLLSTYSCPLFKRNSRASSFIVEENDVGREWTQFSRKTIKVKKRCRIKKSDWKIGNSRVIRLLAAGIFKKIWFWTFRVSRAKSQVLILNQI